MTTLDTNIPLSTSIPKSFARKRRMALGIPAVMLAYLIFTLFYVGLIYPLIGSWKWGGGALDAMGFYDFAGSTLVHSVGGWGALAGVILVGPRIGKYVNGKTMEKPAVSIPLAVIGVFLLWLGWFGFNGGSVLSADPGLVSFVLVTTSLAACAGGIPWRFAAKATPRPWLPLEEASLMRAIELNAVQVDKNKAAFEWGRRAAHAPQAVATLLAPAGAGAQVIQFKKRESVAELIAHRVEFLTGYQNAAYAADYQHFVEKVRAVEAPLGKSTLTAAVARYLFKLMAYKDEYEVARLHSDPAFHARLASQFEGDFKLQVHLAPPLIAKKNNKGELVKQKFGPYMFTVFRWLAKFKGLRGTALDIFGRTEERRTERALIGEYREAIESLLDTLDAGNHALALEIASVPEQIKGYGHVKARNLAAASSRWAGLREQWRRGEQAEVRVA